jgi:hypothetical protein
MSLGKRNWRSVCRAVVPVLFVLVITMLSFAANASTLTWTKLKPTNGLPPRAAFASAYDPVSQKVVVFGGSNSQTDLNDTYTFDGKTWTKVNTSVAPPARETATMAYDRKIRKLVLFGELPVSRS